MKLQVTLVWLLGLVYSVLNAQVSKSQNIYVSSKLQVHIEAPSPKISLKEGGIPLNISPPPKRSNLFMGTTGELPWK
jgi:hypothetical protein